MGLTTFGRFLDWYTGGQITEAKEAIEEAVEWKRIFMETRKNLEASNRRANQKWKEAFDAQNSLRALIAQEESA